MKVLITSAATLPVPAPGTAAAEAFSSANKTLQGGDEEGSQVDGVERSEKAGDAASSGSSTTEGTTPSTGLSQLVGATKVDLSTVPLYLVPLKEAELAQQQAAAALRVGVGLPPQPVVIVQNNQVSSQGCSRVFIIKGMLLYFDTLCFSQIVMISYFAPGFLLFTSLSPSTIILYQC